MDCCAIDEANVRRCPECGTTGHQVGAAPVRPHAPDVIDGPWSYCPNQTCQVVFFLDEETIDVDHVNTRVGTKAASKPVPVCFCFSHTARDITTDLARHGRSTINESVKAAVGQGLCACEHLNPTGKCCLADIRRSLRSTEGDSRRPTDPVACHRTGRQVETATGRMHVRWSPLAQNRSDGDGPTAAPN